MPAVAGAVAVWTGVACLAPIDVGGVGYKCAETKDCAAGLLCVAATCTAPFISDGGTFVPVAIDAGRPIRVAIYEPNYPASWTIDSGTPLAGQYDLTSAPALTDQHVRSLEYAGVQVLAVRWRNTLPRDDDRLDQLFAALDRANSPMRLAVLSMADIKMDPGASVLTPLLLHLEEKFSHRPRYFTSNGRWVVFVASTDSDCNLADRWELSNDAGAVLVFNSESGATPSNCLSGAPMWFGDARAGATWLTSRTVAGFSVAVSPALRDVAAFKTAVEAMAATPLPFHVVDSFNSWFENNAAEVSALWQSDSGYGVYLDVLHDNRR